MQEEESERRVNLSARAAIETLFMEIEAPSSGRVVRAKGAEILKEGKIDISLLLLFGCCPFVL